MSRRRVVRMITRMAVGGPGRNVILLSRGLEDQYETTVAAGRPAPGEGELTDPGVAVRHLPLVRDVAPLTDLRALGATRRLLARTRPELVHTHTAKAGTIGRLAAMSMRPRPRIVHTFHGHVLHGYFGGPAQAAFRSAERSLARGCDAIVAVSEEVRDELLDLGVGDPSRFHVIPVGMDLDPLLAVNGTTGTLRGTLGLEPDIPLVGAAGRMVGVKDLDTMLAAVARLPGVHLALIGDGEERGALEDRARRSDLAGRVHFTGWWTDMPGALADLDVVALTSRNEGTPLALIEAGAAGRAVVATDVGGVRAVVEHGETGLLCAPGSAEGVADGLGRLLADPALRTRMGAAARVRTSERFGRERLLRDVRELYAELLG